MIVLNLLHVKKSKERDCMTRSNGFLDVKYSTIKNDSVFNTLVLNVRMKF